MELGGRMLDSEDWREVLEANYSALEGRGYSGSAAQAVERSVASLCYAFRIYSSVKEGTLTSEALGTPFTFGAGDHSYQVIISKPYSEIQLADGSWNLVLSAFAMSATACHRAFQERFRKKSPDINPGDDREQAWAIIYQLRNAFAHDPFQPVFVPSSGYHRTYSVASRGITFDFAALAGKEFRTDLLAFDDYLELVMLSLDLTS